MFDEGAALFRKACVMPQDISINEIMDGMQLFRYWLGCFEEPTDRFCVFEEVAEIFSKIDDEAFKTVLVCSWTYIITQE